MDEISRSIRAKHGQSGRIRPGAWLKYRLSNPPARRALTRFIGWFSRIRSPWLAGISIAVWQRFADDLRLEEAEQQQYHSLHECFVRRLKPGARPICDNREVLVSPCDAEVGQMGRIEHLTLLQAKGSSYSLEELLTDRVLAERYQGGSYVTLRLKSSMYHRFHAPADCGMDGLRYVSGDVRNVSPETLARRGRIFVDNERAVVPLRLESGQTITLVAVAAILVASIRFHCVEIPKVRRRAGVTPIACSARFRRGEEVGWFEHGSTLIVLAEPGLSILPTIHQGQIIRMGQALLALPVESRR